MASNTNPLYFLENGGEMGELICKKDWSNDAIGSPDSWPQSLQTTLSILLNSPFPMFLWWGKDLICFYNDAYRPSLGIDGKHPSILGMPAKEAWPEIWDEIFPMIQLVTTKGETVWKENQLIPIFRNGQIEDVYWTFSYSPVKDASENVAGVLVICNDNTKRLKAVADLEESEKRFREVADLSPIWIWITDADVNVEYANQELLDYIGIEDSSDFTGQIWELMVHPEDIDLVYRGFAKAVRYQTKFTLEYRVKNAKTEEYEWFVIKGVPKLNNGKLTGFIGTGTNIEKQKSFSEKLKKEVALHTKELAQNNSDLEKMNSELQSFAYISSHDLQEPLRKIQMFAGVLLEREFENLSDKGKNKFERIQSAANRMQTLINDLLAYSRTETEERVFETTSLKELFTDAKNDLREEIRNKNATIELTSNCKVEVIPFQFRQLLYNIMSNSLKYSKENTPPIIKIKGEIVNSSEIDDDRLTKNRNYVHISLSDNGIGFDNNFSEKIFEVFQRLHTRQDYVGTGIGLAIAKKIVQNHNGFISAKGLPGAGAIFEIYIPDKLSIPKT